MEDNLDDKIKNLSYFVAPDPVGNDPMDAYQKFRNRSQLPYSQDMSLAFFVGYSCGAQAIKGSIEEIVEAFKASKPPVAAP